MYTWNERLTVARTNAKKTKSDLARYLRVSTATTSNWEAGNIAQIHSENMLRACKFLDINPQWLIFGIGAMRSEKTLDNNSLQTLTGCELEILSLMKHLPEQEQQSIIEIARTKADEIKRILDWSKETANHRD